MPTEDSQGLMFENPKDRYLIKMDMSVGFSLILLSLILTAITGKWQWLLIPAIPGGIVLLRVWQVEIWHRPKKIIINHSGVTIELSYSRRKEYAWSSIQDIYSHPGSAWTKSGRGIGRGGFGLTVKRCPTTPRTRSSRR
jgi:hypothetical protein